ncbi:MAG: elongation factor G [bacterium]|jgi:elongation factor G|nr:elongation factor G [SAR324 cluster bacterium]GIR30770.1 MAG: elongation factor G 2 [Deltaproteobacteria bacterium]|tara:strand:- start:117 stop:2225 length:2109 start_codon:yes stop_codon:yes gene_type:complete
MTPAAEKIISNTRNIGISAHIDSGKTTLTERILYYAGKIHKIEEVRGKGSGATMDHMELEKEKGITITSAATTVNWDDKKINIIDTPGHVDFTVEVERSLRVLDGAILVLCGVAGIQSQSITVDRQMKRYKVPRLAFINKLDRMGANPEKGIQGIRDVLGLNAVAMQIPIGLEEHLEGVVDLISMKAIYFDGEKGDDIRYEEIPEHLQEQAQQSRNDMLEAVSMFDDQMMEDLLEEKEISETAIHDAVCKGVQTLEFCPVFLGSAFKNRGVQPLLDAITRYLPSPLDAVPSQATDLDSGEKLTLECDPDKPTIAMAFKLTEEQFGQLTYTRIYQGSLNKGDQIVNSRTGRKLRVGRMVRMHSNDRENTDHAEAGDIIAMVGVECASGDTFCGEGIKVTCESIFAPDPVISLAVRGEDNDQQMKMSKALGRFMREDPTFHVRTDEESGETVISGMGELHLDIYIERMRREYAVDVIVGAPQVNYREAITSTAEFDHLHKKQTGGSGQYAGVTGMIEPLAEDHENGFEFVNQIFGGAIPSEHIPACEKGFKDVMSKGPLAAFPMVGIKVTLNDGKYHDVDSSDLAYQLAARTAMRDAVKKSSPVLMEPVMKVEVETPSDFQGSVIGDLSSRRGVVYGTEVNGDDTVINAGVPLGEMFGYATQLRSLTSGKANYSMEFEKYNRCPAFVQEKVIKERAEKMREEQG